MRASVWFTVLGLVLGMSVPATAQDVVPRIWNGILDLGESEPVPVIFMVIGEGDVLYITMRAGDGPTSPVTNLEILDREMTFEWEDLFCSLSQREDGSLLGGCEGSEGVTGQLALLPPPTESAAEVSPPVGADVLTRADLVDTKASNVYDALRRLRPYWIRPRGQARIGYATVVTVYIDRQPMGDVNVLKELEPSDVQDIQFFTASEATMRFGTGNEGGAIVIRRGHR